MNNPAGWPTWRPIAHWLVADALAVVGALLAWQSRIRAYLGAAVIIAVIMAFFTGVTIRGYVVNSRPYRGKPLRPGIADETIAICAVIALIGGLTVIGYGGIWFRLGLIAVIGGGIVATGWVMNVGITWNERRKHG